MSKTGSFELPAKGNKTRWKLTHRGLETFSGKTNPDFAKESFLEGWTYITGTTLKEFAETPF
ncbi:MAG: hypothetical protein JNN00_16930 [Chitinophagaceae bacterium]|nr:hypothetical protein [Chitinophagaceae bacterium]